MQEKLLKALANQQAGKTTEAAEAYREILRVDNAHPDALHLLGLIESKQGNHEEAVHLIEKAASVLPSNAVIMSNLGVVLRQAGRVTAAIGAYEKSIEIDPNNSDSYFNLGKSLKLLGKLKEAESVFRKAIHLAPKKASPWLSLIATESELDLEAAIRTGQQAALQFPNNSDVHLSLGALYRRNGNVDLAVASYRRAVELAPGKVDALSRLAATLISKHDLEEGQKYLTLAQSIEPESVHVLNSLGLLHNTLGNSTAAIQAYRRAIALYPSYGTAHSNLSSALRKLGCLSESLMCVQKGLELEPKNVESRVIEGGAYMSLGRVEEAEKSFRTAIQLRNGYRDAHDGLLMCLQYQTRQSIGSIKNEHGDWNARYASNLPARTLRSSNLSKDRPLRIGFVSADIGAHPVGYFTAKMFESIDKDLFATTIYSDRIGKDPFVDRIQNSVSCWKETSALSDGVLADLIIQDEIDILFDMAGHTAQNRLMIFARRVAPIQITWAGYVGTTGMTQMDYLMADRFHVPEELDEHYSERVLRLPNGYVTYSPPENLPEVSSLPSLSQPFFTFAAMCNPAKVNDDVLGLWAQILNQVPDSRLLLCYSGWPDEGNRQRVEEFMLAKGCTCRIDFEQRSDARSLMEMYSQVDIALDTFPYSGGLTTCEAMWMGVPTITWPGERFAGRHSLSHLSNVGLFECIASSAEEYVTKAVALARDRERLIGIRGSLRERVAQSPLCDGPGFARDFEKVLRDCWVRYVDSMGG